MHVAVSGDLGAEAAAPGDVCCEIAALAPGQEDPMDLAAKPLRCERGAGQSGDRLGSRVRLPGGKAAVFTAKSAASPVG
jgi:hypothetical protein